MIDLPELQRLHDAATPGEWKASHDWEWEETGTIEYVRLTSDGEGHRAILTNSDGDYRTVENDCDDGRLRHVDTTGRANMRFVAAMKNATPELLQMARWFAEHGGSARAAMADAGRDEGAHALGLILERFK